MASKNERGNKSRSKPNEFAERKEEFSSNRRHQREYLSSDERRVARDKDIEEHNIQIEKSEPRDSETDDLKSKQQIEESERSEELRLSDEISAPEQVMLLSYPFDQNCYASFRLLKNPQRALSWA